MAPSSKVIEKRLAEQLGVSRVPIRETLGKLAGQGLLVGEASGQGVRLRQYTAEEIRQLYELRELLEGGASAAAARAATDLDIRRMQMICEQSEGLHPTDEDLKRWGDLDHAFHAALAEASHNDRIARLLKLLLTECHYVFYYLPRVKVTKLNLEEAEQHLQEVIQDHRSLLDLIKAGKPDEAERKAREDMRKSSKRLTEAMLAQAIAR
jgi:DNA-binding GntR family transcriptional regulator